MKTMLAFMKQRGGTAALEFALISPLFILILLTTIAYGIYLSTAHSLQQLAADTARTAIAGLSSSERLQLASGFIERAPLNGSFLLRSNLQVNIQDDPADADHFTVSLAYDARNLPIWQLYALAMPDPVIRRFSTIRIGGR